MGKSHRPDLSKPRPPEAQRQDPTDTRLSAHLTPTAGGPPPGQELLLTAGSQPVAGYELERRLGQGSFGEVWRARGPGGFAVALKFIRLGNRAGDVELRSLELMKEVHHPHLLGMFGSWQVDSYLIVAMELADGSLVDRLHEAVRQGLPGIPTRELLGYMRDAARGIDHINGRGIQHRDIKPHNLLLVGGGVKVADFGLAKVLEHTVNTNSGSMTPAYAAPEFLKGETHPQSDLYSLAVSYCQLRGNRLPFGGNAAQVLAGHLLGQPDLSMLPEAELPVVGRALAKKPDDRWPSAAAFVEALAATIVPRARAHPARVQTRKPGSRKHDDEDIAPAQFWAHVVKEKPGPRKTAGQRASAAASAKTTPLGHAQVVNQQPGPKKTRRPRPLVVALLGLPALALVLLLAFLIRPGSRKQHETPEQSAPRDDAKEPANAPGAITNSIGMKLVLIPAGMFQMGSPSVDDEAEENEKPQHEVQITKSFYMAVYTVTQGEYEKVMGDNPSWFFKNGDGKQRVAGFDNSRFPVESVSWHDAVDFCRKLSALTDERRHGRQYRLPTEAEWEYACRARTRTRFHFGDSLSSAQANFGGNYPTGNGAKGPTLRRTCQVGSYEPNAFGLYDMHGNVWQWCQDRFSKNYYAKSAKEDPQGPQDGDARVLRGGSWNYDADYCRAACRLNNAPDYGYLNIGFRVVMPPAP